MNPLDYIKGVSLPSLTEVLGVLLAASLGLNIFLFYNGQHQVEKKVECVQAVKTVNQQATEKKVVIEKRQDNVTKQVQTRVTADIAAVRDSVQDRRRLADLSRPADPTGNPDGTGASSFFLSEDDELTCNINTIVAGGWQQWYSEQVRIREEEDAANAKNGRISRPRGGDSAGSVSGQRERLDLGAGGNEPVRPSSTPAVLPEPAIP